MIWRIIGMAVISSCAYLIAVSCDGPYSMHVYIDTASNMPGDNSQHSTPDKAEAKTQGHARLGALEPDRTRTPPQSQPIDDASYTVPSPPN